MTAVRVRPLPRARRGTWVFLHEGARDVCHVHLATQVDATAAAAARQASGGSLGLSAMVVKAAADVAATSPAWHSVLLRGPRGPRLVDVGGVHVKVLLDRTLDGERCVMPCTVPSAETLSAAQIQELVDLHKEAPLDDSGPFRDLLRLQRLPLPVFRLVYRLAQARPRMRAQIQGTLSVTSVGQQSVSLIHPMISGALGFGVGRVAPAPMVRDGEICVAPAFTLSLAFDHRVLDGAAAAELLSQVKQRLETWSS